MYPELGTLQSIGNGFSVVGLGGIFSIGFSGVGSSPVTSLLCDLGQTRRQPTLETLPDSLERLQGTAVVGNCAASRDPGTSASRTKSALHRSLGCSRLIYHSCLLIHKEQTGSR